MQTNALPVGLKVLYADLVLFRVLSSLVISTDLCFIPDVLVFRGRILLETPLNVFFLLGEFASFFVCDML